MEFNFPDPRPFVPVFVPYTIEGGRVSSHYDTPDTYDQLARALAALGLAWSWECVSLDNLRATVSRITARMAREPVVVLNLCDGTDTDGCPGISVVRLLQAAGIPFTGAAESFYALSTSKVLTKRRLIASGVATAPYAEIIDPARDTSGICARLGAPLLVKPDVSYASMGVSLRSVVYDDAAAADQIRKVLAGRHGLACEPAGGVFVERFIPGREFTVLIVGSAAHGCSGNGRGDSRKIYHPVERVFNERVPAMERFLSYDRYWGFFAEESDPAPGEAFYYYRLVDGALKENLEDLAARAYAAVDGGGYARVDVRMDASDGELYVLEVNANCGLSADHETSTGQILDLTATPFEQLLADILVLGRN